MYEHHPAANDDDEDPCTVLHITTLWAEAITDWDTFMRAANRPETTRSLRTYHLRRLAHAFGDRSPWDLDFDDLIGWLASHTWSAETRRSYRASLRQFYGWGHATGRIATNPAYALPTIKPRRPVPRPAPDDVVLQALGRARVRERLMISILAQTGIRRGELAQLHTDDVEKTLIGWQLRVRGKGDRVRLVDITDELARTISMFPPGYLFPGKIDGHLSARRVGELVSETLPGKWTAHTLRHRFATLAYSIDRDLRAVQELLGHAKPETTAIYTLVPAEARRKAALAVARTLAPAA